LRPVFADLIMPKSKSSRSRSRRYFCIHPGKIIREVAMDTLTQPLLRQFDDFLLDLRIRVLFRLNGGSAPEPVPLGSRACDVLCLLVEHHGAIVSRQAVIDKVWPNVAVEENNLTVQISALRRVLDEGRARGSCIQTIPGRGYRFLPDVVKTEHPPAGDVAASVGPTILQYPRDDHADESVTIKSRPPLSAGARDTYSPMVRWRWLRIVAWIVAATCVAFGAVLGTQTWRAFHDTVRHPRLSVAVLPFQNLGGNPAEEYLADAITDDLTTDLSHIPEAFVIARESAYTYKGKATDVRQIGHELSVRYLLEAASASSAPRCG
jgi:DNA-binding winged helix-turn-helix (wHTH) protein